jgi:adenylate cyclase
MTCAGCGVVASSGFAFCPKCARRLPTACSACGFTCAPDFAFCPRCGAARAPGTPGAGGPAGPAEAPAASEGGPGQAAPRPTARAVCEAAGLEPDALMVLPFLC